LLASAVVVQVEALMLPQACKPQRSDHWSDWIDGSSRDNISGVVYARKVRAITAMNVPLMSIASGMEGPIMMSIRSPVARCATNKTLIMGMRLVVPVGRFLMLTPLRAALR
jgi:hypothetical protein